MHPPFLSRRLWPSMHPPFPSAPLLQLMDLNESPIFLRLDPRCDPTQKDLPVHLYESGEGSPGCQVLEGVCWMHSDRVLG